MAKILIIDDDKMICEVLSAVIGHVGHEVHYALTLDEGMARTADVEYGVVFLDVRLPDGNGLAALPAIQAALGNPEVIIITGEGDADGAELAIKSGAWDYIEKPLTKDTITLSLLRALQYREEKKSYSPLVLKREGIIGNSLQITNCLEAVARAATGEASTLITGETGTGKELFAYAIHQNSARSTKSFVVVDCAALPETLVESTLFGHEKGAFTGADRAQEGLVKIADGGTLFLDEVGELPMSIQKAFLRVLQERRFRPVGSRSEVESNFRLVAATNRDLHQMVAAGMFRNDLLFRLKSIEIRLPPLRERPDDVMDLAGFFMKRFCNRYGIGTKGFSSQLIEALTSYVWPGNVRELENTMEYMLAVAEDAPILFPDHLPVALRVELIRSQVGRKTAPARASMGKDSNEGPSLLGPYRDFREYTLSNAEKAYFSNLMYGVDWDIQKACQVSQLSRPRLYALLKKYQIVRVS